MWQGKEESHQYLFFSSFFFERAFRVAGKRKKLTSTCVGVFI